MVVSQEWRREVTSFIKHITKIIKLMDIKCPTLQNIKMLGLMLGGIVIEKIGQTKDQLFGVQYSKDIDSFMKNMNKFLILITLFLFGCAGAQLPTFMGLRVPEVEGTPIFKKGFAQGCAGVTSRRGTELFRQTYKYEFDFDLIDNPEYQFGFTRGWTNCFLLLTSGAYTLGGSADTYLYNPAYGKAPDSFFAMRVDTIDHSINDGENVWKNPFGFAGNGIDSIWGNVQTGKDNEQTAFGSHPLYGTPQTKQFFGQ